MELSFVNNILTVLTKFQRNQNHEINAYGNYSHASFCLTTAKILLEKFGGSLEINLQQDSLKFSIPVAALTADHVFPEKKSVLLLSELLSWQQEVRQKLVSEFAVDINNILLAQDMTRAIQKVKQSSQN